MRRLVLVVCLTALTACSKSSREVMFSIDASRTKLEAALNTSALGDAKRHAAEIVDGFDHGNVRSKWKEPEYEKFLKTARTLAQKVAQADTKAAAEADFQLLERACQRCHDHYQFKKQ